MRCSVLGFTPLFRLQAFMATPDLPISFRHVSIIKGKCIQPVQYFLPASKETHLKPISDQERTLLAAKELPPNDVSAALARSKKRMLKVPSRQNLTDLNWKPTGHHALIGQNAQKIPINGGSRGQGSTPTTHSLTS